jgi:ubiquinone/menaquinone biosynthesis C-methylase UbiE
VVVAPANFDTVARAYCWLEYASFGPLLERARFAHLRHLAACRDIVLLGDGDGRTLARILAVSPSSRIVSVDASRVMLDLAARRVPEAERHRVTFVHADARMLSLPAASCDAVVTQFFLDCFTAEETAALVQRVAPALRPHGLWLFADFTMPERGIGRIASRAIVTPLYWFFRWSAHISAHELPPAEGEIRRAGLRAMAEAPIAGGLLRSVVFEQAGS